MKSKIVGAVSKQELPYLASIKGTKEVVVLAHRECTNSNKENPLYDYVVVYSKNSNYKIGYSGGHLYEKDLEVFEGEIVLSN